MRIITQPRLIANPVGTGPRGGGVPPLTLTATIPSGDKTLILFGVTVATGKSIVVNWGDGNSNTYTAGAGTRQHTYTNAGTYTVSISNTAAITALDLQDAKLSGTISASNPMPVNLTSLYLTSIALTWAVSASAPMPAGLTYLFLAVSTISWTVSAAAPMPSGLTDLTFSGAAITWTVSTTNPMPSGLTNLYLQSVSGITWTVSTTNPMPSGLTSLRLWVMANVTWTVSTTDPMPAGLTSVVLYNTPNLSWTVDATTPLPANLQTLTIITMAGIPAIPAARWAVNTLRTVRYENNLTRAQIDDILLGVWTNKANYTYATPSLDLLGSSLAGAGSQSPSGIYQAATPPTTGMEYAYDLVNGSNKPAGPEWTVTICMYYFGLIGDSITATNAWPPLVYAAYKSGKAFGANHAGAGHTIMANMDAQVVAAANDNANGIIIELGTNDDNNGDMVALQAEFEENIAELKISNPAATIYVMGVLPRWTNSGGGTVVDKSNIRAAEIAAAAAQGVTYWDTFTSPVILASDTTDGTHLNSSGDTKLKNFVIAQLP